MDVAGVGEDAVVVAPGVALVGPARAAARAHRLHRVPLQEPVGDVDDVDVLLHDDVAGQRLVVDPVAQAPLGGRGGRPVGPVDGRGEVVDLPRDGRPDLALVDPLRELDVGRGVADLEADREAQLLRPRLLAEGHHPLAPRDVHPHRLLEVDVLARGEGGLAVGGVEPRRARDVHRVHVLAVEERLVGLQPLERAGGVDRGLAELRGHRVELRLPRVQVVREQVADRGQHRPRVLEERAHHVSAPAPAAEDPHAHGRVGLGAEDDARLQDREGGGGGGRAHELAAPDSGVPGIAHGLSPLLVVTLARTDGF